MWAVIILTLATDLIGPLENADEQKPEINPIEVVNSIPEDLLVQVVTKSLEDHPEIVADVLKAHPEIVIEILKDEKNSDIITKVLLDRMPSVKDNKKGKPESKSEEETKLPDEELPPVPEDEPKAVPVDTSKADNTGKTVPKTVPTPIYSLYVYTTEGCGPCIRMMNEIVPRQYEFPGQVYVGKNPTTFRNGQTVTSFPAAEVVRDGVVIKRFVGYTQFDDILRVVKE